MGFELKLNSNRKMGLKSIIFKNFFCKNMSQFLVGGGGGRIFIYVTIFLGEGGVSPNLINVINFTVFLLQASLISKFWLV